MTSSPEHQPATPPGKAAATFLLAVAGFQTSLAGGAPWAAAAYGGAHTGILPDALRASSAVTAVLYLAMAAVAGTAWAPVRIRRRLLYGMSTLMVVGAVVNIASPSLIERLIWVPVTIVLVMTLWRAARQDAATITTCAAPVPHHA